MNDERVREAMDTRPAPVPAPVDCEYCKPGRGRCDHFAVVQVKAAPPRLIVRVCRTHIFPAIVAIAREVGHAIVEVLPAGELTGSPHGLDSFPFRATPTKTRT